jgi:regulator of replication initiation timing
MNINWNQVFTSIIATFLSSIVIGASVIVWRGATTVDLKVKSSSERLEKTIEFTKKAVDIVEQEIVISREKEEELFQKIDYLTEMIINLQKSVNDLSSISTNINLNLENKELKKLLAEEHRKVKEMTSLKKEFEDWDKEEIKTSTIETMPIIEVQEFKIEESKNFERTPIQKQLPQWAYE